MAIPYSSLRQYRLAIMPAVIIATVLALPVQSYAASPEQRCTELGVTCICSEPLQMTALTSPAPQFFDPNDSTTKQCTQAPAIGPGAAMTTGGGASPTVGTDPTVLAALPSGHGVVRYLKQADNPSDWLDFSHQLSGNDPMARVSLRWYMYFSPNFVFTSGACLNSGKWAQLRPGFHEATVEGDGGASSMYAWNNWGSGSGFWSAPDCCGHGPGFDPTAETGAAAFRGKWWRVELIIRNRSGSPGTIIQAYRKNVTDNAPEHKVIDTTMPGSGSGQDWGGPTSPGATTSLRTYQGNPITLIMINLFRNGNCPGYHALSHVMMAAWSTDAGQRIGAAREIEGGATSTVPASPASVTLQ